MSDIKQAAKWMKEGNAVTRKAFGEGHNLTNRRDRVFSTAMGKDFQLWVSDLLAEDWEIAAPPLGDGERA